MSPVLCILHCLDDCTDRRSGVYLLLRDEVEDTNRVRAVKDLLIGHASIDRLELKTVEVDDLHLVSEGAEAWRQRLGEAEVGRPLSEEGSLLKPDRYLPVACR